LIDQDNCSSFEQAVIFFKFSIFEMDAWSRPDVLVKHWHAHEDVYFSHRRASKGNSVQNVNLLELYE